MDRAHFPRRLCYPWAVSDAPRRRWPWILLAVSLVVVLVPLAAVLLSDAPPPDGPGPDVWRAAASEHLGARVFESCASCHLSGAEGRGDGSIPRLAGQLPQITAQKLRAIAAGTTHLPVMTAFARALSEAEIDAVSTYLAALPASAGAPPSPGGAGIYGEKCLMCHGPGGVGVVAQRAPRLCGQHAAYTLRRMNALKDNLRGDGNSAMAAIVATLTPAERAAVADYLSAAPCEAP